jgi:hypothetical protein
VTKEKVPQRKIRSTCCEKGELPLKTTRNACGDKRKVPERTERNTCYEKGKTPERKSEVSAVTKENDYIVCLTTLCRGVFQCDLCSEDEGAEDPSYWSPRAILQGVSRGYYSQSFCHCEISNLSMQ